MIRVDDAYVPTEFIDSDVLMVQVTINPFESTISRAKKGIEVRRNDVPFLAEVAVFLNRVNTCNLNPPAASTQHCPRRFHMNPSPQRSLHHRRSGMNSQQLFRAKYRKKVRAKRQQRHQEEGFREMESVRLRPRFSEVVFSISRDPKWKKPSNAWPAFGSKRYSSIFPPRNFSSPPSCSFEQLMARCPLLSYILPPTIFYWRLGIMRPHGACRS